jgi:sugar phosphate isomerase/epimerase
MRFAVFTVSTPDYTPEEAVRVFSELGYSGVEWRVTDQVPSSSGEPGFWAGNRCTLPLRTFVADAPRIKALAQSAGLETINVGGYARCDELEKVEQVLLGASLLGAPSARVNVPRYDGTRSLTDLRETAQRQFKDVEALATTYGVRAVVETHPGTIVPSASAVASFLAPFDPEHVGALWDPGNMVKEGFEKYQLGLETLGPYLAHVQLKNAVWRPSGQRSDGSQTWSFEWAPLRTGLVNVPAVFDALQAVGYSGWISLEDFSTDVQPTKERLRDNLAYLTTAAEATTAFTR